MNAHQKINDHDRQLGNMLELGTIAELDEAKGLVKVNVGGLVTDWVPFAVGRAGPGSVDWCPPDIGEQVEFHAPYGDPSQGWVGRSIYQDAHPASGNSKNVRSTTYADGTVISYDRAAHTYLIDTSKSSGKVNIVCDTADVKAATSATIDTPTTHITGDTIIDGNLTVQGDTKVAGETNVHGGMTGGGGINITGDLSVSGNGSYGGNLSSANWGSGGGGGSSGGGGSGSGGTPPDLTPYLKIADAATTYVTKTDAAATYMAKFDLSAYVTSAALAGYALKTDLAGYAKTVAPTFTSGAGADQPASALTLTDSDGSGKAQFLPSAGSGNYNRLTQAGDTVIVFGTALGQNNAACIVPWANAWCGIRMDGSGVQIPALTTMYRPTFGGFTAWDAGNFDPTQYVLKSQMPGPQDLSAYVTQVDLGAILQKYVVTTTLNSYAMKADLPDLSAYAKTLSPSFYAGSAISPPSTTPAVVMGDYPGGAGSLRFYMKLPDDAYNPMVQSGDAAIISGVSQGDNVNTLYLGVWGINPNGIRISKSAISMAFRPTWGYGDSIYTPWDSGNFNPSLYALKTDIPASLDLTPYLKKTDAASTYVSKADAMTLFVSQATAATNYAQLASMPHDIHFFASYPYSKYNAYDEIYRYVFARQVSYEDDMGISAACCSTPPAGPNPATFHILCHPRDGSAVKVVADVIFNPGQMVGLVESEGVVTSTFYPGDCLTVVAAATMDATIRGVAVTLVGRAVITS